MTDSSMVPTATGVLERTPLSNLLIYCLDKAVTGTIVLQAPDTRRHALYVQQGVVSKVRTADAVAPLGRVLIEQGVCKAGDVDDAAVLAKTMGGLIGQALIESGRLDAAQLLAGLKVQSQRKVVSLFGLPDATAYAFFEGRNLLETWGGPELVPLDSLWLIWAGFKVNPPMARAEATLGPLSQMVLKLHVNGDFRRFGLSDRVRGVVDLLKVKPMTLEALVESGVASKNDVKLAAYTFLITRHLDLGGAPKPPVGFVPPEPSAQGESARTAVARVRLKSMVRRPAAVEVGVAPPSSSHISIAPGPMSDEADAPPPPSSSTWAVPVGAGDLQARRAEIRERAETIDREEYFTALGLDQDAAPDVVKAAYFQLAKRWHPDRLPPELTDMRDPAAKVFARLTEAFQTLTDPERRRAYVERIKAGGGTPEEQAKVIAALEAQADFQKAEVLLKKGDVAGAEKLVERASKTDPDQPDYRALLAWVRASQGATTIAPELLAMSLAEFDAVLKVDPKHQRALWYRGILRKRAGRDADAVADFKALLELNPKHVDAMREVRIYEMRSGATTPTPPPSKPASSKPGTKPEEKSGGGLADLMGKLFKK